MKECVCDGRSEGPTEAVLSTRKLKEVEVEDTRRSLKVALTPQVGAISKGRSCICVLEGTGAIARKNQQGFLLSAAISAAISPATLFFSKGGRKK